MTSQTGLPLIENVILRRRQMISQISHALSAVRPVILELRSHAIRFRAGDLRLGSAPWTVELSEGTATMDEEDYSPEAAVYMPNELSQWASSMVELATAVDATKDKDAKRLLLQAMDGHRTRLAAHGCAHGDSDPRSGRCRERFRTDAPRM